MFPTAKCRYFKFAFETSQFSTIPLSFFLRWEIVASEIGASVYCRNDRNELRNCEICESRERETGACSEEKGKLGSLISEYEATSNDHRGNIPYTVERRRGATERILFNRRPWRGNRHEFWSVSDSSTVPPKYLMKHSGRNMGPRIPPETAWSPWPASPARPPLLWYITSLLTRPALSIYW